jgi:hypothetical protein
MEQSNFPLLKKFDFSHDFCYTIYRIMEVVYVVIYYYFIIIYYNGWIYILYNKPQKIRTTYKRKLLK